MHRVIYLPLLVLFSSGSLMAGVPEDITQLSKPSSDPGINRAAWDRLVAAGPSALLPILKAWPTDDPVATNWLRTAFDRIAHTHSGQIPVDDLIAYLSNPKSPGKARRTALAVVEKVRPGTTMKLLPGWLNDPEFGSDAVTERLAAADAATDAEQSKTILRATFAATTDVDQALAVGKRLKSAGDTPDVIRHLGIISRWHVIGPFPVSPEEGLNQSFPPETKVDLTTEYEGKNGKLKWISTVCDPLDGRVDLPKLGIKPDDGAVAYAVAKLTLATPMKVEARASVVDNVTIWVNGKKVIERASEYRSTFRPDRYRAAIELPAGESIVLVKLVKTRAEEVRGKPGAPVKWDFLVRLVDGVGHGYPVDQSEGNK